ncbi:activator of Hsp90 ATPase 1 family protein [Mycolicibacterium conceptionense]|uniref:Activator of Hsp90 ATPase 1 family protein n=1 Tax=Mycolicibacterium conceptionense TaxID=451644 RepID=A0A0U1DN36_9MYCO|nr:activator of Hsp90 ATPase 1 family protein [Mycolicibacterium conceptionense]
MTDSATVRVRRVMPAAPDVVFDEWLDLSRCGSGCVRGRCTASMSSLNLGWAGECVSTSTILVRAC